jgi:hypothetical protein
VIAIAAVVDASGDVSGLYPGATKCMRHVHRGGERRLRHRGGAKLEARWRALAGARLVVAVLVGGLALAAPAGAAWRPAVDGSAYARGSALAGGNAPAASATGRNVELSWEAIGGPVPATGYVVHRYDAGGAAHPVGAGCSGVLSGLGCTEDGVAAGQWHYTVAPARAGWRGGESPRSAAVAVAAPSLTLAPTTVNALPATLTGRTAGYLAGQTVTFRLGDPVNGQVVAGSITPSPVPPGGAADVSITLPAGTPDGTYTIYAVGSQGDVASVPVTVAAACSAPGAQTVPASKDSYVDSLAAGSNFGTAATLALGPSYLLVLANQRALVQFDFPAVPARCTVTGATLRLYATAPAAGRTIQALRLSAAWTETGVNWSNQPGSTGTAASSASLSAAGWQAWSVLDQVQAMYAGTNHGFLLRDSIASGVLPPHQTYQSRNGLPDAQDPQLVLTFG